MSDNIGIVFNGKDNWLRFADGVANRAMKFIFDVTLSTTESRGKAKSNNKGSFPAIIGSNAGGRNGLNLGCDSGNLAVHSDLGDSSYFDSGKKINDGKKHNVKLVADGTNLTLYLDSEPIDTGITITRGLDEYWNGGYKMGVAYNATQKTFMNLVLYELKIYNSETESDEHLELWYKPTKSDCLNNLLHDYSGHARSYPVENYSYKYVEDGVEKSIHPWKWPELTANGTPGGDTMAVWSNFAGGDAYKAFRDDFTVYLNRFNSGNWIRLYTPDEIHMSLAGLRSSSGSIPSHGIIQASDDGNTWTTIGTWDDEERNDSVTASVDDGGHTYHYFSFQSTSRCAKKPDNNADVTHIAVYGDGNRLLAVAFPAKRVVVRTLTASYALSRELKDPAAVIAEPEIIVPAVRRLVYGQEVLAKSSRRVLRTDAWMFKTARSCTRQVAVTSKAARIVQRSVSLSYGTSRTTGIIEHFFNDIKIRRPVDTTMAAAAPVTHDPYHPLAQKPIGGTQSMEITLGELSLSDTFQIVTTKDLMINDIIKGQILDFPYRYCVEETDQTDILLTAQGMYDKDSILYFPHRFLSESAVQKEREARQKSNFLPPDQRNEVPVSSHWIISQVARCMGLGLKWHATDYLLEKGNYAGDGHTFQSIISSAFGWTNTIPMHMINVFMRAADNCLHVVQRGMESKVTDINGVEHTRPNIHREIVRTMWSSRKPDDDQDRYLYVAKTGTTEFQGITITYSDGLLTYTKQRNPDGGWTKTYYDYGFDEYGGAPSDNVAQLLRQRTVTFDGHDHYTHSKTTYYHPPEVPGYVYAVSETDGEFTGASLSQQEKRASVSKQYAKYCLYRGKGKYAYVDSFIADASIPLVNSDPHKAAVINEIKKMNRMVKETITMDIYDSPHVYDFDERLKFRGHEYFLSENKISKTPRIMKQTIKMVRWFR